MTMAVPQQSYFKKADEKEVAYHMNGYCQKQRETYWEFSHYVLWKDGQALS